LPDICWIAVGDELLNGSILDTNLQFLAETLASFGLEISRGFTVRDTVSELHQIFNIARSSDLIFVSGGLGPTSDDLTLEAFSTWSGLELEFKPEIFEFISKKVSYSAHRETKKQCLVPKTFSYLLNNIGTAPCIFGKLNSRPEANSSQNIKESTWIFLPGVPSEFKAFLQHEDIKNILSSWSSKLLATQELTCYFQAEGYLHNLLSDVLKNFKGKIGFYFSYPRVKIVLTGKLQEISETFEKIQSALKSNQVKYVTCNSVEQEVHNCLKKLRLSISTCESFTGGLLANSLMQYPTSSSYFRGGLILYSLKEKAKFLEKDITNPVTEEIALKLAIKTRERFETDLAVSTTGVAGPGEDEFGNEEGLMYIATATAMGARAKKFQLKKDRSKIIVAGVALALFEILDLLKESKEP